MCSSCQSLAFLVAICAHALAQAGLRTPRTSVPSLVGDDAAYELALLNGGPRATITAAAAKLPQGGGSDAGSELERSMLGALGEARTAEFFDVRRDLAATTSGKCPDDFVSCSCA